MAVYVDPLKTYPASPSWKYGDSCHLFADTPEELHTFAREVLHLGKGCFQGRASTPHYDLSGSKRTDAVMNGAIEVAHDRFFLSFLGRIQDQWREIAERSEG